MKEIEIQGFRWRELKEMEKTIETVFASCGLKSMLKASLAKFPGCIHWHLKKGNEKGILEITCWEKEQRLWFSVHSGRDADWISGEIEFMKEELLTAWN